jgi:hypothetical protein
MIDGAKRQRPASLPQHAVKESPGSLNVFVKARQHSTRRTLLIMMTLYLFMASRTTLDHRIDFQYKFCALGLIAYMAIEGGFHTHALVKLHQDLRTWGNATFLICISMLLSRCIFFRRDVWRSSVHTAVPKVIRINCFNCEVNHWVRTTVLQGAQVAGLLPYRDHSY